MTDQRLRHRADIRATLATRCAVRSATVRLHARIRDDDGPARWTVVAGRAVGSAVERNRAKRRLRAVLARVALPDGADLIAVAMPSAVEAPSASLHRDVARSVQRAWLRATERHTEDGQDG